jgi:hypothetical protein
LALATAFSIIYGIQGIVQHTDANHLVQKIEYWLQGVGTIIVVHQGINEIMDEIAAYFPR